MVDTRLKISDAAFSLDELNLTQLSQLGVFSGGIRR
jgi:hypothetical protein